VRRRGFSILMILILLGVISAGLFWYNGFIGGKEILGEEEKSQDSPIELKNRVSVLLIGADQRPDEIKFNTDSLILASIDPKTKQTCLLSIPRDTRVALTGHGYVRINQIAALTDLPTLQKNVEKLTGVKLAGYVQTNFAGFKKIIDTLGGITVDVEKDMYYETGDIEDGYINLKKGVQRLNGSQALQYARFRHDALADISRTARQQVVLKAVANEMFKLSTLPKLPFLVPQLMEAVNTNLAAKDIFTIATAAVRLDSANVISQTLPGTFLDVNGVSYWKVDPAEAKEVVKNLFMGITTTKVIDQQEIDLLEPIIVKPSKPLPKVPNGQDPNDQDPDGQESPEVPGNDQEPNEQTLPIVPGNSEDPNGQESPDYKELMP
jgi:LCP family protein required for cell wall assembly